MDTAGLQEIRALCPPPALPPAPGTGRQPQPWGGGGGRTGRSVFIPVAGVRGGNRLDGPGSVCWVNEELDQAAGRTARAHNVGHDDCIRITGPQLGIVTTTRDQQKKKGRPRVEERRRETETEREREREREGIRDCYYYPRHTKKRTFESGGAEKRERERGGGVLYL